MPSQPRPLPYAESILPYLDSYRKVMMVPAETAPIDRLPARGTAMRSVENGIGLDLLSCSETELDYVYSHARNAGSGQVALFFTASRTGTTAYEPVLTHGGSESYTWPMVLKKIEFDRQEKTPLTVTYVNASSRGVALLPRWYVTMWRRKERPGKWPVRVNHYLSSEPFPFGSFMRFQQPDPGYFDWDLAGHSYEMDCLHETEKVPVQSGSYRTMVDGTAGYVGNGKQPDRVIPATRMTDWREFSFDDSQEFLDGLWHRIEILMPPPPLDEIVPKTLEF